MSEEDRQQPDAADDLGLEGHRQRPQEGISLDQLSEAFAEMLGSGDDPYDESKGSSLPESTADAVAGLVDQEQEALDDTAEVSPLTILEAMLFIGKPDNSPLSSRQVASHMRGVRPEEIDELVKQLNTRYAEDGCPYHITSEGAGYRLRLREQYNRVRDKFYGRVRQATLSQAAIEVLAIVAYNQAITTEELNKLRGTASGGILAQLVRRQLLRIERSESAPRTRHYHTTDRFLQLFGLQNLDDLPRSQELDNQ